MRWTRCHSPSDTGLTIRALAVWGLAIYLSVTVALHNTEALRVSREETFCFFETWMPEWGTNPQPPTFQACSLNHGTNAPASWCKIIQFLAQKPDIKYTHISIQWEKLSGKAQKTCIGLVRMIFEPSEKSFNPCLHSNIVNILVVLI